MALPHIMVQKGGDVAVPSKEGGNVMNCLCNLFDDCTIWIVIIALIVLFCCCGNGASGKGILGSCGCGC